MALHDTGAFWLSQEADIKNPYFGKEMLECGETVDSLN
jgi:Cu(I)/Ag(I) efflux system membrane fusion protein